MQGAIRVGDLEHHLDQPQAAVGVERALQHVDEIIVIKRLVVPADGGVDETRGLIPLQAEARRQNIKQASALGRRAHPVRVGDVHQQRGRGQPVVAFLELAGVGALVQGGLQLAQQLKHGGTIPSARTGGFAAPAAIRPIAI